MEHVKVSRNAGLWTVLIALALYVPIAAAPLQNTDTLQKFHNRTLKAWPSASDFMWDPPAYFKQISEYLSDRAFPIMSATVLQKKILYYVLQTPPQRRVTLGRHGHVFLNGASDDSLNALMKNTCMAGHSPETIADLQKSFTELRDYGRRTGREMYFVIVPMTPTLYADDLPKTVPLDIRRACLAGLGPASPLVALAGHPELHFVYPLLPMMKLRSDDGFFPKANYHPSGESLQVIRDAFLEQNSMVLPRGETMTAGFGQSEILSGYGIDTLYPKYVLHDPSVSTQPKDAAALSASIEDLFQGHPLADVFANTDPDAKGDVLMLSDSVGIAGSSVFAAGFHRLSWIYTNGMDQAKIGELIDRAAASEPFDAILLLTNEGGSGRFSEWAKALSRAAGPAP